MEPFYPLQVQVCDECFLVQLAGVRAARGHLHRVRLLLVVLGSWVEHARRYAEAMIERLGLGRDSLVVEIASNDGYLLQHFVARACRCSASSRRANVAAVGRGGR